MASVCGICAAWGIKIEARRRETGQQTIPHPCGEDLGRRILRACTLSLGVVGEVGRPNHSLEGRLKFCKAKTPRPEGGGGGAGRLVWAIAGFWLPMRGSEKGWEEGLSKGVAGWSQWKCPWEDY